MEIKISNRKKTELFCKKHGKYIDYQNDCYKNGCPTCKEEIKELPKELEPLFDYIFFKLKKLEISDFNYNIKNQKNLDYGIKYNRNRSIKNYRSFEIRKFRF